MRGISYFFFFFAAFCKLSPSSSLLTTPFLSSRQYFLFETNQNVEVTTDLKPYLLESKAILRKVCRICKTEYNPLESNVNSCRFHKGRWMGAENSKHMGTRSGGSNVGLSLFWDCCDEESETGPGCCCGPHKSYDD